MCKLLHVHTKVHQLCDGVCVFVHVMFACIHENET